MHPVLLLLADGRFPAGAHAYSAGVESAVRVGGVSDLAGLERYLDGRLAIASTDASFAAAAAGAAASGGDPSELVAEYGARILSPRLRSISRRMGRQFVRAAGAVWDHPGLDAVATLDGGPHQPLALGAATIAAGGSPLDAAVISVHHLAGAVATAGVRLLGLDPLAVARLQAAAVARLGDLSDDVAHWLLSEPSDLPALGGTLTEILGEAHGAWGSRLFVA